MAVDAQLLTVDDLVGLPDDGRRVELVRGELVEMPPPGDRHGEIVMTLGGLLVGPIKRQGHGRVKGESGVVISRNPDTVLAPDVSVVLSVSGTAALEGYRDPLPAIVFEVVSPWDSADAVQDKLWMYVEAGVPIVVAVWPRRPQLTVVGIDRSWSVLTAADELDLTELVPELRIPVSAIFE